MNTIDQNLGLNLYAAKPAAKNETPASSRSSSFENLLSEKSSSARGNKNQASVVAQTQSKDSAQDGDASRSAWPSEPRELPNKERFPVERTVVRESPIKAGAKATPADDTRSKIEQRVMDESVDNLAHRQALQNLLKRMKEELGLDAEQIVGAFATLSAVELSQPPEMSLEKIIQALPLNPEQMVQARAIFQEMLKQTAADEMADYLKASNRQLSLEVVSQREAQKRQINRAVESMQSQFFYSPPPVNAARSAPQVGLSKYMKVAEPVAPTAVPSISGAAPAKAPVNANLAPDLGSKAVFDGVDWQQMGMMAVEQEPDQTTLGGGKSVRTVPSQAGVKAALSANATEQNRPSATDLASASAIDRPAPDQSLVEQPLKQSDFFVPRGKNAKVFSEIPIQSKSRSFAPQSGAMTGMEAGSPTMDLSVASLSTLDSGVDDGQGEQFDQADLGQAPNAMMVKSNEAQPLKANGSFVINTQPTAGQQAENIREVVSQAQFLARKGGGEVKIELAPEGLGKVNMKVVVEGGQVNVEMIADSTDAKRLLEKGLGDLKATLQAHNLKIDQIRVETPADVARQLLQNHDEAQRQFAQQFMEQFRQENNEWRRGFFDIGGARQYRSQRDEAERLAVDNPPNNRSKAGTRRLDLVA